MKKKIELHNNAVAQAQRDTDFPCIEQAKEEMRLFMIEQHEIECALCKVSQEEKIEQAKTEAAREIFNWGNEPCPHQFYANTKQQCRACWDELRNRTFDESSP